MKERIVASRENLAVYLSVYFSWFCWCIILCALPIGFSLFFADLTVTYSSLLAYCFTLLGSSVYLFDHHVKAKDKPSDLSRKAARDIAILLMFVAIMIFIMYNLSDNWNNTLNDHIPYTLFGTSVLAFFPALFITMPLISKEVKDIISDRKANRAMEDAREVRAKAIDMGKQLGEEASAEDENMSNKLEEEGDQ